MFFSDLTISYLKKYISKCIPILIVLFVAPIVIYIFDLDFQIQKRFLPRDSTDLPEKVITTPIKVQNMVYNEDLGLLITSSVQITGKILGANKDSLQTSCPFREEKVKLYNRYFSALTLSVNGRKEVFIVTPQGRLVRQFFDKLSTSDGYLRDELDHKITLFGYALILRDFLDVKYRHIVVNKVILDGVVYQ